ncbi:MAG: hypothetical protein LBQ47_07025 [Endomicrobium sp.]|jgi:hypothetical protein|nr:hypothetical protein [Endomicrobium sp.]
MKKIVLALFTVIALASVSFAAPKYFIGAGFNINSSKNLVTGENPWTGDSEGIKKGSEFGITPTFGYIIDDNSDVSISVGYSSFKYENIYYDAALDTVFEHTDKYESFSVGVGYERLILSAKNFYFYIWGGAEYATQKYGESKAGYNINFNITPNVQYGLTDNIYLFVNLNFLSLNYDTGKYTGDDDENYHDFSFGVDTNDVLTVGHDSPVTIGVSYLF